MRLTVDAESCSKCSEDIDLNEATCEATLKDICLEVAISSEVIVGIVQAI